MPIGWIDYSREERNKVVSVLDLLSEKGTLDELGIAPIRDGFANIFFPGTSTIQTRAKYFFIVPYACRDIEISEETSPEKAIKTLDDKERQCGEKFLETDPDTDGLIGGITLKHDMWVKRPPSSIYWAGLQQYQIFKNNQTIREYIHANCAIKKHKKETKQLGNHRRDAEEGETDDRNAEALFQYSFWNIPTYSEDWFAHLDMKLTKDEGRFLLSQIKRTCQGTLMELLLKEKAVAVKDIGSFRDMRPIIASMPTQIKNDYDMAVSFSEFIHVLQTAFTLVVTADGNKKALDEWNRIEPDLPNISDIGIDGIFRRLDLYAHNRLKTFLQKTKVAMLNDDLDELKRLVTKREIGLKGLNRAKSNHLGEFDKDAWYGGGYLNYRFNNAKSIIMDIFESVGIC